MRVYKILLVINVLYIYCIYHRVYNVNYLKSNLGMYGYLTIITIIML